MKIAYIDDSFHKRTKSTGFLSDILTKKGFNVEFVWDSSWCGGTSVNFDELLGKYDAYIFFQSIPQSSAPFHNTGANIIYIPMLDSFGSEYMFQHHVHNWKNFLGCKVLCFSKSHANAYLSNGVVSKFFQYFPNPYDYNVNFDFEKIHGFFWSRRPEQINWSIIKRLMQKTDINSMHIHLSADPGEEMDYVPEDDKKKYNITVSEWFENKDDYTKEVERAQLYFAPRVCEGIGMSFLEAMAMGKCVVAPNCGTMNEYIKNGHNGMLYDLYHRGAWRPIENTELAVKNAHLNPESLSLSNEQIRKISANARLSIELGYQEWKSKEDELVEFITADTHTLYRTYYGRAKGSTLCDIIPGPDLATHSPDAPSITDFQADLSTDVKLDTSAMPKINPLKETFFTEEKPDVNDNSVAGRILEAPREGVLAEGGLRTQGIYRTTAADTPLVSIITVVYNGAEKLERAIQSVIGQAYPNIEYIIVDGGSTDGSVDIIKRYSDYIDYFISQKDYGIYDAMNKGVALSFGEYIGIVNSDDMMLKNGISVAVKEILLQKADYIAAKSYCVDESGSYIGDFEISHLDERCLVARNPCSHGAMLIGKNVYNKVGYYDTKYSLGSDFKLQTAICLEKQYKGIKLHKNIHYHELAGASIIHREKSLRDVYDIIAEFIPDIDRNHLHSLVYFMHERKWNDEVCSDLEKLLASGIYNDLQKDFLISEMQKYGYDGKYNVEVELGGSQ